MRRTGFWTAFGLLATLALVSLALPRPGEAQAAAIPKVGTLQDVLRTPLPAVGDTLVRISGTKYQAVPVYDAQQAALFASCPRLAGNGSTDDTAAIASRLTAISGNSGNAVLRLPPGVFKLNSGLTGPAVNNIVLEGSGQDATTIQCNFGGYPSTTAVAFSVNGAVSGLTIRNMTLKGGAAADDTGCYEGITLANGASDVLIENVTLKNFRHSGLRYTAGSPGRNLRVSHCTFTDNLSPAMAHTVNGGAILGCAIGTIVESCFFKNNGTDSTSWSIYLNSGYGDCIIAHCFFDETDNQFSGIQAWTADNHDISVVGNTFLGLDASHTSYQKLGGSNLHVAGNHFIYATVQLYTGDYAVVEGNDFFGSGVLRGSTPATRAIIQNNTFVNPAASPLNDFVIYSGQFWTIRANQFENCKAVYIAPSSAGYTSGGVNVVGNHVYYDGVSTDTGLIRNDDTTGGHTRIVENQIDTGAVTDAVGIYDNSGLTTNVTRGNEIYSSPYAPYQSAVTPEFIYDETVNQKIRSYFGSATYDPASLANGASAQTTVTATGAVAGDLTSVSFSTPLPAGLIVTGQVTSANTVTVTFYNIGAGTTDLATGTLRVLARHKV